MQRALHSGWAYRISFRPTSLPILLGALLVVWQILAGALPQSIQWATFICLLAGTGIPHGALDHLIDRETTIRQGKKFSFGLFLANYLFTIGVFGISWFLAPAFSLCVFIVSSAWHFGETDIDRVPPTLGWSLVRFATGGFVLAFILLTHATEVTPILERIANKNPLTTTLWLHAVRYGTFVWAGLGCISIAVFTGAFLLEPVIVNWVRLGQLTCLLAICYYLPLLPAFALYFGGWHALSSFETIYHYIEQTQATALTPHQIWLKALPFTLIALVTIGLFISWWQQSAPQQDLLPFLFVFLSLITLPHLRVMHGMNSQIY